MTWEPVKLFMNTIVRVFSPVLTITGGFGIILLILGVKAGYIDQVFTPKVFEFIEFYGPLGAILLVLIAGVLATYQIWNRMRDNYYAHSYEARKDKAYRIFYQLWSEAETVAVTPRGKIFRADFDKKLQQALRKYCTPDQIDIYLGNTGNRRETNASLEHQHTEYTRGFVRGLLLNDFYSGRPLIL